MTRKALWKAVGVAVLAGVVVCGVSKINTLSNEIDYLRSQLSQYRTELDNVRGNVSRIYDNVDEQMKKEASLISAVEYSFGTLDTTSHEAEIIFKVVPKNISDGMQVSINSEEKTVALQKDGNYFTGAIPVNIFLEDGKYPLLSIKTSNGIQTELLEQVYLGNIYYNYLPTIGANVSSHVTTTKGTLKLYCDVYIRFETPFDYDTDIKKIELVTEQNGKEVESIDVTKKVNSDDHVFTVNGEYSLETTEELKMFVVAEDSAGYIHKILADSWTNPEEDGEETPVMEVDGTEYIYDKEGNLLNRYEW